MLQKLGQLFGICRQAVEVEPSAPSFLLLADGSSFFLLADGVSKLKLSK